SVDARAHFRNQFARAVFSSYQSSHRGDRLKHLVKIAGVAYVDGNPQAFEILDVLLELARCRDDHQIRSYPDYLFDIRFERVANFVLELRLERIVAVGSHSGDAIAGAQRKQRLGY